MRTKKMWKKTWKLPWKKICLPFAALSMILLMLTGCAELSEDQKTLIDAGAVAAKERASSFRMEKKLITAKNPAEVTDVNRFLEAHGTRLNSQAKGLSDLSAACRASSKISEQMRIQISNEADTARDASKAFQLIASKLAAKSTAPPDIEELANWEKDHAIALETQAGILAEVAAKLNKNKKPSPPPVPTPPTQ